MSFTYLKLQQAGILSPTLGFQTNATISRGVQPDLVPDQTTQPSSKTGRPDIGDGQWQVFIPKTPFWKVG